MAITIVYLFLAMASSLPPISLAEYQYDLPESRIAKYPCTHRDESKLLIWKEGQIHHKNFNQLSDYLPVNTTLFLNNTKVIPARLLFEKETGAVIEVFLLAPADSNTSLFVALEATEQTTWKCTVGNAKRWGETLQLSMTLGSFELTAAWQNREEGLITFQWTPAETPFAQIIGMAGAVPLPPYLKRDADIRDIDRYQTVYSHLEGAVAAPTAGLHFTPRIFDQLQAEGIQTDFLTLHVSAGTFIPIKTENAAEHKMHEEEIVIRKSNIVNLLQPGRLIVAVGTTTLRTLESLYWYGVLLRDNPEASFAISQDLPYRQQTSELPTPRQALELVLRRMDRMQVDSLTGHTSIYIIPGYQFRIVQGLMTNFHQPGSTLLVLISAFVGEAWQQIYQEALDSDYRFLSYGDTSLLLPVRN